MHMRAYACKCMHMHAFVYRSRSKQLKQIETFLMESIHSESNEGETPRNVPETYYQNTGLGWRVTIPRQEVSLPNHSRGKGEGEGWAAGGGGEEADPQPWGADHAKGSVHLLLLPP